MSQTKKKKDRTVISVTLESIQNNRLSVWLYTQFKGKRTMMVRSWSILLEKCPQPNMKDTMNDTNNEIAPAELESR